MGLFLRMMKGYFSTGMYVVLGSGLCVLKWFIQLRNKGFFTCAVIKKRRYWPSMVPGKDMEDHFVEVGMCETDAIQVTVDDIIYNLWRIKDSYYVMSMMATRGRLLDDDTCRDTVIIWKENGE